MSARTLAVDLDRALRGVARALRTVAGMLDPDGWEHLDVHVDAGSPEQVAELTARIERAARREPTR